MFGSVTANELLIDKGKPEIDKGKPNKCLKKQSKLALPLSERQSKNQNSVRLHGETQKQRPEVYYNERCSL